MLPAVTSDRYFQCISYTPAPTFIGPEVNRRQRGLAPPPWTAGGAISSTPQDSGCTPNTSSGGLTVSGGYRPLAGLAGAMNVNSIGGSARSSGSSATCPWGVAGAAASSLARIRNDA